MNNLENKNVKTVILVGCGRMGYRHFQVIKNLKIRLVALVDTKIQNAEHIAQEIEEYDKPKIYQDFSNALKNHYPDIVVIASHANTHAKYALIAINKNIPFLLVEKPIANSISDCNLLLAAEEKSKTKVAVNHQMRFAPNYLIPKELLNSEDFGGLTSMHVAAGDFGMAMNSTHIIEGFRFLTGENPFIVNAWFEEQKSPNPRGKEFKDVSGCMRVVTKKGKRLYIDASNDQGQGVHITFMARYGRITLDELEGKITTAVRLEENRILPETQFATPSITKRNDIPQAETITSTQKVLSSLLNDKNYPNLKEAILAVATLIGGYYSSKSNGIPVKISSILENNSEILYPWA